MPKKRPNFIFCILFVFIFVCNAYAMDLDNLKSSYISGDYKAAIREGEKLIAASRGQPNLDELYYFLALSYLKDGNYLRSWDIFEIIINEFSKSNYLEEAKIGLADTYFLRQDYPRAKQAYSQLLESARNGKLKSILNSRLKLCADKEKEIPAQPQEQIVQKSEVAEYSVQVGAFSSIQNAKRLTQELSAKNHSSFIEHSIQGDKDIYRVKAGKFAALEEAQALETILSKEGYPTKICP